MWHTVDRTPVLSLQEHTGVVLGLSQTVDGQRLASASLDGMVEAL